MNRQIELITEITLLCQLVNYRLDELEPCIFKHEAKLLTQNLMKQSEKLDKIINAFTTRLEGGEQDYAKLVNDLDNYFKKLHHENVPQHN